MFIEREISKKLKHLATQFPVIALIGPRQSGKTTLAKHLFSHYVYVSLEDKDIFTIALQDPRRFLTTHGNEHGLIIDEAQRVPELFSYLQGIVDGRYRPGYYILTGSQNFLLYEKITQSLAGRIALLTLFPLSVFELEQAGLLPESLNQLLLQGCYPRIYAQQIGAYDWLNNYVGSYIERDVRQVLNIADVVSFQNFLSLCAARVGNLLNYAELARDAEITHHTVKSWISVLETSFITTLLHPYYRNFSKRIIKSPKLYFNDTGLVCFLLGIKTVQDLAIHPLRGAIFEAFIFSEVNKWFYNQGLRSSAYFWRDVQGHEIDGVIEKSFDTVVPLEIKAGVTIQPSFFKGIQDWQKISGQQNKGYVIYGGDKDLSNTRADLVSWRHVHELMQKIL